MMQEAMLEQMKELEGYKNRSQDEAKRRAKEAEELARKIGI
jgi:hypothetical protein